MRLPLQDAFELILKLFDTIVYILVFFKFIKDEEEDNFYASCGILVFAGIIFAIRSYYILLTEKQAQNLFLGCIGRYSLYIPCLNFFSFEIIQLCQTSLHGESVKRAGFGKLKQAFTLTELAIDAGPQLAFQAYLIAHKFYTTGDTSFMEDWQMTLKALVSAFLLIKNISGYWFQSLPFAFFGPWRISTLLTRGLLFFEATTHAASRIGIFIGLALLLNNLGQFGSLLLAALILGGFPFLITTIIFLLRYKLDFKPYFRGQGFSFSQRNRFIISNIAYGAQSVIFYEEKLNVPYFVNKIVELIVIGVTFGVDIPIPSIIPISHHHPFHISLTLSALFVLNLFIAVVLRFLFEFALKISTNSHYAPIKIVRICNKIKRLIQSTPVAPLNETKVHLSSLALKIGSIVDLGHLRLCPVNREDLMVNFTESCVHSFEYRTGGSRGLHERRVAIQNRAIPEKIDQSGNKLIFDGFSIDKLLKMTFLIILYYYKQLDEFNQNHSKINFREALMRIARISLAMNPHPPEYRDNPILNFENFEFAPSSINLNSINEQGYNRLIKAIFDL